MSLNAHVAELSLAAQAEVDASNAEVVEEVTVDGKTHPLTRRQLIDHFNAVADRTHWKNPIDCEVSLASDLRIAVIRKAVIFFTGSVPTFTAVRPIFPGQPAMGCVYRVKAAGYYATIGA